MSAGVTSITAVREEAERIAVATLLFITNDPQRLESFLDHTGLRPDTIRQSAGLPTFLRGVMDYANTYPWLVTGASQFAEVSPERWGAARLELGLRKAEAREARRRRIDLPPLAPRGLYL